MQIPCLFHAAVVFTVLALGLYPQFASATNILWDGTGTSWNAASNWSLFSNATTPNPAAKPGASDTAIFNIEIVNTPQSVNLNAAQSALGLSFNSTGPVSIQTGTGTNTLTLGSGGITVNPGAGINTITSALTLSAPQTWTNNSGNLLTLGGAMTHGGHALTIAGSGNTAITGSYALAGNVAFTKNGAGTLSINAASDGNASASLLLHAGNIAVGNPAIFYGVIQSDLVFGAGSTGSFTLGGNDIPLADFSTNAVVGSPVVQNASATPATLTVGIFNSPQTFAGVLRDGIGGGSLGITVQGPMTLSGNNLHTGVTQVNSSLKLEHANALGSTAGGTIISGTLDLRGLSIVGEPLTVPNGGQLTNSSLTPAAWTGNVHFSGGFGDDLTVQGIGDLTLSGGFSGSFLCKLVKIGPNTVELTGNSNNSTSLRVSDGVVRLAKTSHATVHAADTVTVDGGTVQLAGTGGDQISFAVDVDSGTFDTNGRSETMGTLTLRGSGIGGAGALVNAAGGDSVITTTHGVGSTGSIFIDAFARIGVTQAGANLTLPGELGLSGGDFQKVGLGTLILNGDNFDYFGDVFLSAGTIAVGNDRALGKGAVTFDGGALRSEAAPRTLSNVVNIGSSGVVTGSIDLTLAGAISGTGGLTKSGSGRLTLSAMSNYSGTATIDAGTLAVNGSITGNAAVNSGGTLAGAGTIGGTVTLNSEATLAPGNSAGQLTVGALAMNSGSTFAVEIGGTSPGTQHDKLTAAGALALDGALEVVLINSFAPAAGNSFDILDWGMRSGAFSSVMLPPLNPGLAWNTSQLYTSGVLSIASAGVPGDYNNNGAVDAADYVLWRKGGPLVNEVDSPGIVNAADYSAWRARYGNTSGTGAESAANTVPEPNVLLTSVLGCFVGVLRWRRINCT